MQTSQWTSSEFFYSRICSRKYQGQQKTAKEITHLTKHFCSKNLTHFTNPNSFEIENNMLSKHSQKAFLVYKFSRKYVSVSCQENYFHSTISWRPRATFLKHFERNVCIFLYISLRKFLFQICSKILSGGMAGGGGGGRLGVGGGWIISLRWLAVWVPYNVFILIEIFWNSTIF